MALTRAQVETVLIKRCGQLMAQAELEITTAGSNSDLNDPIGYALRRIGLMPANISNISDSDFVLLNTDDLDKLFDIAELRTLKNIQGNLTMVDTTTGPLTEKLSQLGASLEKQITRVENKIAEEYGNNSVAFSGSASREDGYTTAASNGNV